MESGTASELIKALDCMEKALDNPPSHSTLLESAVEPQDSTIESDSALLFNLLNSKPSAPPVSTTPLIDDATASETKAPMDMKEKFHKLREKFQQQATVAKGYTSTGKFAKKAPPPPPCNISENLSLNMDIQSKPRELDTKENLG
ncbi:hypothetical protein BCR33DRAFT_505944 [Rhizoclosmatium globosum]|uniref:Uncharacterized protein n=1 Tax=Rhizoclosmatium globosum TaxID=329046 RepID=A0A1Y2BKF3_9FUNG|nr:hypothetical protein BCR33DRAFT_505944 [Rhizoclosmatium globosum]|eukprot:ORY35254.1 hypothetical protein BCR33DRAFT_505944 [Rhizoclosmatium globosum]